MAMLEDVADLTLKVLNEATQAWVEYEYNRQLHSEIGQSPLARFLAGPDVSRPSPDSAALRLAFTRADVEIDEAGRAHLRRTFDHKCRGTVARPTIRALDSPREEF